MCYLFDHARIEEQMKNIKAQPFKPDKWDVVCDFISEIDGNIWHCLFVERPEGIYYMDIYPQ